MLDANGIAAATGTRFMHEDSIWPLFHGGMNEGGDRHYDIDRTADVHDHYELDVGGYVVALWEAACAAHRTIVGRDAIKMLCIDLDDTLWRGTIGDTDPEHVTALMVAGWPLGVAEALLYLKKRGVVLAILSKNEEHVVRDRWDRIFDGKLRLDDFAIRKIDWRPKSDTIAEAMAEANLLPQNVAFLDDNPREREAVRMAFADIRVIDAHYFHWRRILGWSAELQVPAISDESGRRTELIRARTDRERIRGTLSRDAFLASLDLAVHVVPVRSPDHPRFARAFELVNKTNQFNTTGRRWSDGEVRAYLEGGGTWWTFDVTDRFSRHGLVGVACLRGDTIDQFVMSCRVAGLDVEYAALHHILTVAGQGQYRGTILRTERNAVIADIF